MSISKLLLALAGLATMTSLAFADSEPRDPSLKEALINFIPVAIILVILYAFFRRQLRSMSNLQKQGTERHAEHMQHLQRIQELLERLVVAIEKNNNKP